MWNSLSYGYGFAIKRTNKSSSSTPSDSTLEQTTNADTASQRLRISPLPNSISKRQRYTKFHFFRTTILSLLVLLQHLKQRTMLNNNKLLLKVSKYLLYSLLVTFFIWKMKNVLFVNTHFTGNFYGGFGWYCGRVFPRNRYFSSILSAYTHKECFLRFPTRNFYIFSIKMLCSDQTYLLKPSFHCDLTWNKVH